MEEFLGGYFCLERETGATTSLQVAIIFLLSEILILYNDDCNDYHRDDDDDEQLRDQPMITLFRLAI